MKISNSTVAAFSLCKSGSGFTLCLSSSMFFIEQIILKPLADTNCAVAGPLEHQLRHCKLNIETGALPARGQGGNAPPPIFVFAPQFLFLPPDFFLAPPSFLEGRSCCFWAEKTLKFVISAEKVFGFWRRPFFLFFLEIICFW